MSRSEQSIYNEVFISYSRKDGDFARKIVEAIYADGRENIWIDWEDIEYAEDWWQKIQQGIDSAENFIFILTPDSARSQVCYNEVDYAVQSGKRIIPLAHVDITEPEDFEQLHSAISQHNWLPFHSYDDFDEGMTQLFKTLDTDLAHVRFHTRLQTRAREWENADKNPAYLLSIGELDEAQNWLRSFALEDKVPLATDLQRDYIGTSQIVADENRAREKKLEDRARRNRLYLGAAIPSIIGLIITSIFAFQAFNAAQVASEERQAAIRRSVESDSISDATFARFEGRDGDDPLLGLSYALNANSIDNPPIQSQITLAELAFQAGAQRRLEGHLGEIWGVAFSPDGQWVFSGAGSFTGEPDNRLIQWDTNTGEIIAEYDGHTDRIYSVTTSPDGRYVATGSQDTNIIIWDLETGEQHHLLGDGIQQHGVPIFGIRFTNDSTRLISAGSDRIIVWDVETGRIINRFNQLHTDHILGIDISSDDRLVLTGSLDRTIRLWDIETGETLHLMEAGQVTGAKFFPDGQRFVTSDQDGNLIIWDIETGESLRTIPYENAALRGGVVVTSDGERLIAADEIGNVAVWELARTSNSPVHIFQGHDLRINAVAIHPNGYNVASASFDRTVIIWDILGRDAEIQRFNQHEQGVSVTQFSSDSAFVAIGTLDGMLEIHDATTGELIREIHATDSSIYDVGFSNDGTMIAVASEDKTVTLWDVSTLTLQSTYDDLQAPVRTLDYSVNGLLAVAGGQVQVSESRPADNRILIWDAEGQLVQELIGHQASVRTLVFTSDGTQILSGSDDGRIIRWNVETGEQLAVYDAHTDAVWSLAINQDSTQFLSGSRDTTIFLWEIANTTPIATLDAHTTGVRALAFHPNGDFAVSGAGELDTVSSFTDYDLLYWDLSQQAVLRQLPGHTGTVRSLVFNTEGDAILSAGDDGAIIAWHADTLESLIDRIRTKYQVVCLPNETGCVDASIVASDTSDETDSTDVGFPVQLDTVESYAPNSLCVLPPLSSTDEGYTPQSLVDTQQFVAEPPYVIGYSHGNVDNTWDDWVLAWAQYQVDQNGETISGFQLRDANGSGPQQVRDLRLLADGGADVIIINPIERAESNMADLEREIEAIIASGIPVVLVGNRTFNPVYTTYVGYDPYEVGCIMAQELTASLDGEGSIAVINGVDVSVADVAYKAGEEAIFNQYGGILLTIEGPTAYNRDTARTQTERQGVAGMVGYNSGITLGAQEGLASQGLAYVPFSSGHSVEIARFADENNLEASLIVRSNQMGATAIETALAILRGEEVSQFIRLVPEVITTDDLDPDELLNAPDNAYLGDWQTLPEEYYPEPDANTQ